MPTEQINIHLSPELTTWLKRQSYKRSFELGDRVTISELMKEALGLWMEENGDDEGKRLYAQEVAQNAPGSTQTDKDGPRPTEAQ